MKKNIEKNADKMPEYLGPRFRTIDNKIQKYFAGRMMNEGKELTRMQCGTIRYLIQHKEEEIFQKDYEKEFSISGATATNILKVMEKDGIIERIPLERDGRLKKLQLTEKGYRLDEKARQNIENLEKGLIRGISEEEITIFSNVLERMIQNIVELTKDVPEEN